jgi:hypothetical protein
LAFGLLFESASVQLIHNISYCGANPMSARNVLAAGVFWAAAASIALAFGEETELRRVKLPLEGSPVFRMSQSNLSAKSSVVGNEMAARQHTPSASATRNRAAAPHVSGKLGTSAHAATSSMTEHNWSQSVSRSAEDLRQLHQYGATPTPSRGAHWSTPVRERKDALNSTKQRGMIAPHGLSVDSIPERAAAPESETKTKSR